MNYGLLAGGDVWNGRLGEIVTPALVIHGTEDPVLPYAHGVALAREIRGASLLTLEGTGHEPPIPTTGTPSSRRSWGTLQEPPSRARPPR